MKIQESAENYLETILMLSQRGTDVRSIDIANELDFSKPSVSIAMKNLRENLSFPLAYRPGGRPKNRCGGRLPH